MHPSSRTVALTLTLTLSMPAIAVASSHRETPNTWQDPCTDHTDLYAWVEPGTHDRLYVIQVYNGLHEPGQGNYQTSLCDDVLYEFHVARGNQDLNQVITYQIELSTSPPTPVSPIDATTPVGGGAELLVQLSGQQQTYAVRRLEYDSAGRVTSSTTLASGLRVSPPNIGPRTDRIAYGLGAGYDPTDPTHSTVGLFDEQFMVSHVESLGPGQGRAWVGEADDPFYLDEDAIFDVLNLRGAGVAKDVFAGFNANVIALEIPTTLLTGTGLAPAHDGTPGDDTTLAIWNTTSRRKVRILHRDGSMRHHGPWQQVSRQGLPLVNAGLIGTQDQHKYLRTHPRDDVVNFGSYFLCPVLVRDLEFLGTYAALGVPQGTVDALKCNRTDILDIINLIDIPTAGAHNVAIAPGATGDVLRVDLAIDSGFPNGRPIPGGAAPNQEQADVSDVLVSVIATGALSGISDAVNSNDKDYLTQFPFVAVPHEGFNGGHGALAP